MKGRFNVKLRPRVSQAINLLPANVQIREIQVFLESVLEEKAQGKRCNQVVKSLLQAEFLRVSSAHPPSRPADFRPNLNLYPQLGTFFNGACCTIKTLNLVFRCRRSAFSTSRSNV